ncbi:MAG: response regulator [Candidatus Latescibacteria bacterium]|nr:response regulator [Candidatus Latescibacterota bacterium]
MLEKSPKKSILGPLLNTGDVAHYCDVSVMQVNRWIKKGALNAFKNPGGNYRISKKEFREFLDCNKIPVIEEFFGDKQKKILVADDDASLVKAYTFALKKRFWNVKVETATDGYETLIKTGKFNPDILILDIRMPKIDGLEVCRRLRDDLSSDQEIKILVITAHSSEYDRHTVLASGAHEYLIKPIPIPVLLEQIEKML